MAKDLTDHALNLTAVSATPPIEIGSAVRLGVSIKVDTDNFAWGSAVVEVQYTFDPEKERWFSFVPAKELSASRDNFQTIGVTGIVAVRLKTTTADGGGDPIALYDWTLSNG